MVQLGVIPAQSLSPCGLVIKMPVANTEDCGFESHRGQKLIFQILISFKNY